MENDAGQNDKIEGYQNHHPPGCRGCPLDKIAKGFCLGSGDPQKAKYAVILEAPGRDEVQIELKPNPNRAFLKTAEECERELGVRRRDYPGMLEKFLRLGAPVCGQTGLALQFWIFPKVGITREQVYFDNTIRCLPPKSKSGAQYPTGEIKKAAELACRQYDRIGQFRPDTVVFSLHPAGLLREITPLPLAIKDFEKVRDFTSQGRRVLALLGGKATSAFARYGSNVTRWRGHYAALAADWSFTYKSLFEYAKKARVKRVAKAKASAEDSIESDYFGVPQATLRKARVKVTRPEGELAASCKGCKRYQGKRPPRAACAACWTKFEEVQDGKT